MKNAKVMLISICCLLGSSGISICHAQSLEQLDQSLQEIGTDLRQKILKFSWDLTEEYLKYCEDTNGMIDLSSESYLKALTNTLKPKELEPYEKAREKANKEIEDYMMMYYKEEYARVDSIRKNVAGEQDRKDADAATSNFRIRLWNKDEKFKKLSNGQEATIKKHRLEAVKYMFNEYKGKGQVMPTSFINHTERQYLLSNNAELKRLSNEINSLEVLVHRITAEYQKLKYNIDVQKK